MMPGRRMRWMVAGGAALSLFSGLPHRAADAGNIFHKPKPPVVHTEFFHTRVPVRAGLPAGVAYGHDTPYVAAWVVTDLGVEEQVLIVLNNPTFVPVPASDSFPWQASGKAASESILNRPSYNPVVVGSRSTTQSQVVVQTTPTDKGDGSVITSNRSTTTTDTVREPMLSLPGQMWTAQPPAVASPSVVRRKAFAPKTPTIIADDVMLDRIALATYETGHVAFTGRVSHSGGADGLVRSSEITLRVRGYGQNLLTAPTVPNGPMYWEMRKTCRVSRGESVAISLVPVECCETVRARYDEVTHLEVVLETRHAR